MVSALLILRSRGVWPWSPRPPGRKEEGRNPWPLLFPYCFPLLAGRWEGDHGLCPSDLGQWGSVAKVTPNPLYRGEEGRKPWSLPF